MNGLYRVVDIIKEYANEQKDISQVIEVRDPDMLDDNFWKKNLYPIALIYPGQVEWTSTSITTYTIQLLILSQRDISDSSADRWNNNDNFIDNLNICESACGWIINKIRLLSQDEDLLPNAEIMVDGIPVGDKVVAFGQNMLDGYQTFLRLQVYNSGKYC